MGLDMYLFDVPKEHNGEPYRTEKQIEKEVAPEDRKYSMNFDLPRHEFYYTEGTYQVAYWRKANHIHKWFVDNVQDGVDECEPHIVASEQLVDLMEKCRIVLANRDMAEELLPAQAGFFFGGTEYDEFYFEDIADTVKQLEALLTMGRDGSKDLVYRSSW